MVPRVVGSNPISHPRQKRLERASFFVGFTPNSVKMCTFTPHLDDMARIMAIDLGRKRSGIAVTDPLQIIANGLTTVESHKLVD